MTLFIIVYLLALCCYFYTRTNGRKLYRIINKYIMASMYLIFAIIVFFRKYDFVSCQTMLMAALFLAWLGDLFLVFDFGKGGIFFFAGNICFILYEQMVLVDHGFSFHDFRWAYLLAALVLCAFALACQFMPDRIKMGKMRWPMTFYLSSIITHGMTGLALAVLMRGTNFMMTGAGSVLFMVSDMILTFYKFVFDNNKWLIRANSLTYFTGLLLIVLSTA